MSQEKNCKQLYQEYLDAKGRLGAQINGPDTRGTYKVIDHKDALKPKQLARELIHGCESFLREIPGAFLTVERDADEQCTCGHSHGMHGGLKSFNDGEPIPKYDRSGDCRATDCKCKKFAPGN